MKKFVFVAVAILLILSSVCYILYYIAKERLEDETLKFQITVEEAEKGITRDPIWPPPKKKKNEEFIDSIWTQAQKVE